MIYISVGKVTYFLPNLQILLRIILAKQGRTVSLRAVILVISQNRKHIVKTATINKNIYI